MSNRGRRPKQTLVQLVGINADALPGMVADDWWTSGRNVFFKNGETCRVPGEARFGPVPVIGSQFAHYVDVGPTSWWITGGDGGVLATDGTTTVDITPAGWAPIATKNLVYTVGDLNGVPFVNHPEVGPFWWDADPTHDMVMLPGWPASWTARVMRAHKNFLLAGSIDTGAGLLESQVSWSASASPGQIPPTWAPSPSNDAGDLSFAKQSGPILELLDVRDQVLVCKAGYMGVMQYVGGTFVFEKRDVFPSLGIWATNAAIELGNMVYMMTGSGEVIRHDLTTFQNILTGVLQDYLAAQLNYEFPSSVFFYRDDANGQVCLAYPIGTDRRCVEAITIEVTSLRPGIRDLPGVYGAGVGTTSIESNRWDDDPQAWDDDDTTWNESASGYQPAKVVFAGGATGLIEQGASNDALDLDGNPVPVAANVNRSGVDFGDYDRLSVIDGFVPRVRGIGAELFVQFGFQTSDNAPADLAAEQSFVIGTDERLDADATGRLLTINIRSDGGPPWQLAGIMPEARKGPRW